MTTDTAADTHNYIRAAVIEHLRHWWASDALFHQRISNLSSQTRPRQINPQTLRLICQAYGVSRGLRSGKEGEVAKVLQDRLANWPDTLLDRAARVRDIAVFLSQNVDAGGKSPSASAETMTKGVLLSGVSKVVWFLEPEEWTLYDSFARRGVGTTTNDKTRDEYDRYYRRLDTLDFSGAMRAARKVIRYSAFPYLWPERIYDKYLMLCGHDETRKVVQDYAHADLLNIWTEFHGKRVLTALEKLTDDLILRVGEHRAFSEPIRRPKTAAS